MALLILLVVGAFLNLNLPTREGFRIDHHHGKDPDAGRRVAAAATESAKRCIYGSRQSNTTTAATSRGNGTRFIFFLGLEGTYHIHRPHQYRGHHQTYSWSSTIATQVQACHYFHLFHCSRKGTGHHLISKVWRGSPTTLFLRRLGLEAKMSELGTALFDPHARAGLMDAYYNGTMSITAVPGVNDTGTNSSSVIANRRSLSSSAGITLKRKTRRVAKLLREIAGVLDRHRGDDNGKASAAALDVAINANGVNKSELLLNVYAFLDAYPTRFLNSPFSIQ